MDIKDVIKLFCHTNKPIIYTIVYDKVINCIVSNLQNYNGIKIYDLEDVYDISNLIDCITYFKYDYIIYKYNCYQLHTIVKSVYNTSFYHIPHYINIDIFNINININKDIDILLYGNISDFYPFRQRLFNLIKNSDINYYEIKFPGYGDSINPYYLTPIIEDELALIINKSKFTICTCSNFDYLVKKYLESAICGSVIIGNMPTIDNIFDDNYINLDNNMTDSNIINIIKDSIHNYHSNYIQNIRLNAYNIIKNNFIYQNGSDKFNKFINYILQHNTI